MTSLSKRDMYQGDRLGARHRAGGHLSRARRVRLQEHYEACSEQDGLRPTLIIDEAQDMRPDLYWPHCGF